MSCVRPKRIINPKYKGLMASQIRAESQRLFGVDFPPNYYISIPCGNCLDCQKRKFTGYRMRLLYELQKYPHSIFVTLTFDNPSLSEFKDNPNKSLRLFLDRFRKKYGKQVRHWFVAEYGSKRGRLHYHGILFNCDIGNDELESLWKYGNTFVGYANEATAKYIVKYLTKQDTKGLQPPRIVSSFGIGASWLDTPECKIAKKALSPIIYVGGYPTPLPRFYIDKMFTKEDKEHISYYYYMETPHTDEHYLDGRLYTDIKKYNYALYQKYLTYKSQGFLFDEYIKKPTLSRETRFSVHVDFYFTNFIKFNYE